MSSPEPSEPSERTFGRPPDQPAAEPPNAQSSAPRWRVHASTIVIISAVLIMVVGVAVVPIITPAVERWLQSQRPPDGYGQPSAPPTPPPTVSTGSNDTGGPGDGDPYYPDYGSSGYNAQKYTINLNWAPSTQTLSGATTITAYSKHELISFYVDLVLPVTKVWVDGQPAKFSREGIYDVKIVPRKPVAGKTVFRVKVQYGGNPAKYRIPTDSGAITAWWVTGDEVTAASEPEGSAWWYPSDDHPSDPATYDVSVRVPAGYDVISNGVLLSRDTGHEAGFDTWHWATRQTLDTYQSLLSIGHYQIKQGSALGMPYVYAVSDELSPSDRAKAFANLEQTPKIISTEESVYGPFPYKSMGGLVTGHDLWYDGLESATRPVYDAKDMIHGDASSLMSHELAHMWFGDHVTLTDWTDIFDNEAYASFTSWWYAEKTGGPSANSQLQKTYNDYLNSPDFWQISMVDPGRDHLFDAVYLRGPMTLEALRNVMGDKEFFKVSRDWAQRGGVHSLEQWMAFVQKDSGMDLKAFFQAWLYGPTPPAKTKANGFV